MNFIPLRLGELTIPTLLKFLHTKEKLSSSIQPIWISIVFDIAALLILVTIGLLGAIFYDHDAINITKISQLSSQENIWFFFAIALLLFTLSVLLVSLATFFKKLLDSSFAQRATFTTKSFSFNPKAVAKLIPSLDFSFTLRILTLSFVIRISKYLALASLFFSLSTSSEPSYRNILIIIIGFISAEFFSSLPGSGVMGFGGYELTFQFVLSTLNPQLDCPLSYITSIHLMGLGVEIILATIVVPLCLLFAKHRKLR